MVKAFGPARYHQNRSANKQGETSLAYLLDYNISIAKALNKN